MCVDARIGMHLLSSMPGEIDGLHGERLTSEQGTHVHEFQALHWCCRASHHVDGARLKRTTRNKHGDHDPPGRGPLVLSAYLPWQSTSERTAVAEVDVKCFAEQVLQPNCRHVGHVRKQQVKVFGCPCCESEAELQTEPTLQDPSRITCQPSQHPLEDIAVAHTLGYDSFLRRNIAETMTEAHHSRVTHRVQPWRVPVPNGARNDLEHSRPPARADAAS